MSALSGKVALVTGGTRGIGRGIAIALAREGAQVTITGRDEARAREVARELGVTGVALDVSDRDSVERAFGALLGREPALDILVNNAGITRDNILLRMKPDDWNQVLATNLTGVFQCCQAALKPMIRRRFGRIVNVSSVVGLMGNAGQANYAAAKAGIIGFTKALAREVASRNVTVNAVAPGYITSDMTDGLAEDVKTKLVEEIPMGRIGAPEDVAGAVLYLVSDAASYVTGQVLSVNGGMYM